MIPFILKDPQRAIPKGTFLAILITTSVYLGIVWTTGGCIVLSAIGFLPDSAVSFDPITNTTLTLTPTLELVQDCERFNVTCEGGLLHDNGVRIEEKLSK